MENTAHIFVEYIFSGAPNFRGIKIRRKVGAPDTKIRSEGLRAALRRRGVNRRV